MPMNLKVVSQKMMMMTTCCHITCTSCQMETVQCEGPGGPDLYTLQLAATLKRFVDARVNATSSASSAGGGGEGAKKDDDDDEKKGLADDKKQGSIHEEEDAQEQEEGCQQEEEELIQRLTVERSDPRS